ncbi:MAG TPA: hypothetical protein VLX68_16650 [Chitinivibrionales bacterium]|nr:hypothetical protein [Chitinivibrionales bacterium]
MQTNRKSALLLLPLRRALLTAAIVTVFAAPASFSGTIFWISPEQGDTVWSNGTNWSAGRPPAVGDTVIFGNKSSILASCGLDLDASVAKIIFRREYAAQFDFNGHTLAITGDTADFRTGGSVSSGNGRGGLSFEGAGQQKFFGGGAGVFFPGVTVRCGPKGSVCCFVNGMTADTLRIVSGALLCGDSLVHRIGNVQAAGGGLDLGSSSLVLTGAGADLSGVRWLSCEKGALVLAGSRVQQVVFSPDSQTIHLLALAGTGGAALSKASGQGIFIDSLEIKSGMLAMVDSASITVNVLLSSHGGLNIPLSHRLTVCAFADFSALDSLQVKGALICEAQKSFVTIIPKSNTSIPSLVVAKGKMQAAVSGIVADTVTVSPACTLSLGKALIHNVNDLETASDAVINFESSTLRFNGDTLDLSSAGTLVPGSGAIEFAGITPQALIPKSGQVHPAIVQSGAGGTTLLSRNLAAGNLLVYGGKFDLNGFFASVDSVKGSSLAGNDTLEFGTSSASLLRARGCVYLDNLSVHGGIRLEMAGAGGQELRLDGNSHIVKLVVMGSGSCQINAQKDARVGVDTLAIRSGLLDLGENPAAPFSMVSGALSASGGGISFGGSALVFTGDTADLSRLSTQPPRQDDGGIEFGGKAAQVYVPKTDAVFPSIIQSGNAGTSVIANGFSCNRLAVKSGVLRLGTALSHTVASHLAITGGGLDFGTSTLAVGADSVDLSGCDTLVPGNGTLSFTGSGGTQIFVPKKNALHPNLIKSGNGTVTLSGPCTAKKLWISGGTFDFGASKCALSGFSAIGGTLATGSDSLIITGNALFTGLSGLFCGTGPVVVRAGSTSPVSIFSCTGQTIGRLVLSALPSGGGARIIAAAGTHLVRYCTFEWGKGGDSAVFDFRQNGAGLAVADSADARALGSGPDKGGIYMGNGAWTFQGNFGLSNYARDNAKIVFSRDSGTQTLTAPLPLADLVHSGKGTLSLASAVRCRNFTQSAGALDFRGNSVLPENDFLLVNGTDSTIAASAGFRIEAGRTISVSGSLRRYCTFTNAPACTVNAGGALIARYAVLKNCLAGRQKGAAFNSADSLGNAGWSFTNKPSPLSGFAAKRGNGLITLAWNRSPEPDVMRYLIYSASGTGAAAKFDSTRSAIDTTATISGLTNGKTYSFCVSVLDSAGYESDCSGPVSGVPDSGLLDISASRLSFGKVPLGASRDSIVTLYNGCSDTLAVSLVVLSSAAFTRHLQAIRIPPRNSLQDTLRFTPKTGAPDSGLVVYLSNAASSPDTIRVFGEGLSPRLTKSLDTVVFELADPTKPAFRTVLLKNAGNDTLRVSQVTRLGTGDFIWDSMFTLSAISDLAPGDSCLDTVRFFPKKAGVYSALFLVKSNCVTPLDTLAVLGKIGPPPASQAAASPAIPKDFSLADAVVMGKSVIFKYGLPSASHVTLDIYNAIGRFIDRPLELTEAAREYQFTWDASQFSRGIYFCRFKANDADDGETKFIKTIRLVFSK